MRLNENQKNAKFWTGIQVITKELLSIWNYLLLYILRGFDSKNGTKRYPPKALFQWYLCVAFFFFFFNVDGGSNSCRGTKEWFGFGFINIEHYSRSKCTCIYNSQPSYISQKLVTIHSQQISQWLCHMIIQTDVALFILFNYYCYSNSTWRWPLLLRICWLCMNA